MERRVFVSVIAAALLAGCGQTEDRAVKAKESTTVTRWKYDPQSAVGTPKGIILEQSGNQVSASFVYLKEGDGFVVERKISHGKYYPEKRLIVFPPGMVIPEQVDELVRMNVPRVEVPFTPGGQREVLNAKWLGQGSPEFEMHFLRVQTNAVPKGK
jgi:hypothetical protein